MKTAAGIYGWARCHFTSRWKLEETLSLCLEKVTKNCNLLSEAKMPIFLRWSISSFGLSATSHWFVNISSHNWLGGLLRGTCKYFTWPLTTLEFIISDRGLGCVKECEIGNESCCSALHFIKNATQDLPEVSGNERKKVPGSSVGPIHSRYHKALSGKPPFLHIFHHILHWHISFL